MRLQNGAQWIDLAKGVRVGDKKPCATHMEATIALLTLAPAVRYTAGHGPFPVHGSTSALISSRTVTSIVRSICLCGHGPQVELDIKTDRQID